MEIPVDREDLAALVAMLQHEHFTYTGQGASAARALKALEGALIPPPPDPVCQHGVAMDVHCCGCHSGFLFDTASCSCLTRPVPPAHVTDVCYRCQMQLPLRLLRFGIGPRGGTDAVCAACSPEPGSDGDARRAEVIALRRERLAHGQR